MKNINTPIKEWEQSIKTTIFEWIIEIWEVKKIIQNTISNKSIKEILSLENNDLKRITKIIKCDNSEENLQNDKTVQKFINETIELRKNFNWTTKVVENDWKKYLIAWPEDVYEISEQKWNIVIWYNPLKKTAIIYNLETKNIEFLSENEIKNSWVDGYYTCKLINQESTIIYINNNWVFKNIWNFKIKWLIKNFWNIVYFPCIDWTENWKVKKYCILNKHLNFETIQWEYALQKRTLNWKNVLFITTYINTNDSNSTSIYDCDEWKLLLDKWINVVFNDYWEHNDWVERIWNAVKFDRKIRRFKFTRFYKTIKDMKEL